MAAASKLAARDEDPTSNLPTAVLALILSLLPLKSAMLCATLSRSWSAALLDLLSHAASFDFGHDFADGLSPEQYSAAVDRALSLHSAGTLQSLKILFKKGPGEKRLKSWLKLASSKGMRELEFSACSVQPMPVPGPAFHSPALTHLSLSCCSLTFPLDPYKLPSLKSLSLEMVTVWDHHVEGFLRSCPFLEALKLKSCSMLRGVCISSPRLQSLMIIDCISLVAVVLMASALRSLHIYDNWCRDRRKEKCYTVAGAPVWDDVYICTNGDLWTGGFNNSSWINALSHCSTITLSSHALSCIDKDASFNSMVNHGAIPFAFRNTKILQILFRGKYLNSVLHDNLLFFRYPALEQLLIEISTENTDGTDEFNSIMGVAQLESMKSTFSLDELRVFSVKGFDALGKELKLVEIFVEKAVRLEVLLLLMIRKNSSPYPENELLALENHLAALPKASPNLKILLCRSEEDIVEMPASVLASMHEVRKWAGDYFSEVHHGDSAARMPAV